MPKPGFVFLTCAVILLIAVACVAPTPTPIVKPTPLPISASAPIASSSNASATPTSTPIQAPAEEEDCMAGCHIPDPNEYFGAGAVVQPATHTGYKTCLNCHATLDKPALPATHLGRQDPACPLCHK